MRYVAFGTPAKRRRRVGFRTRGRLALLAAAMRAGGAHVGVEELLVASRELARLDAADRVRVHYVLRRTLCTRHEDFLAFEAAFPEWFGDLPPGGSVRAG